MDPNANTQSPIQAPLQTQPIQPNISQGPPFGGKRKVLIIVLVTLLLVIGVGSILILLAKPKNETNKIATQPTPSPFAKPTLPPFPEKGLYVENELVVRYILGKTPEDLDQQRKTEIDKILEDNGVISQTRVYSQSTDPALNSFYSLKFKEEINIEDAAKVIYEIPEIQGVEPNVEAILNK